MRKHDVLKPTAGGLLTQHGVAHARNALRYGGFVVVPSDTGFALAVDAGDERAVRALRLTLGMPDAPLSVAFASLDAMLAYTALGEVGVRIAAALLPGPLTICAPMTPAARGMVGERLSSDETIGGRIPDSAIELQLSASLGLPLTTTAIRDDRGDMVHDAHDAYAILSDRLDDAGDELGYLPLVSVIAATAFQHREASTVIKLDAAESRIDQIRPGPTSFAKVRDEGRRLGPLDVPDDWT